MLHPHVTIRDTLFFSSKSRLAPPGQCQRLLWPPSRTRPHPSHILALSLQLGSSPYSEHSAGLHAFVQFSRTTLSGTVNGQRVRAFHRGLSGWKWPLLVPLVLCGMLSALNCIQSLLVTETPPQVTRVPGFVGARGLASRSDSL